METDQSDSLNSDSEKTDKDDKRDVESHDKVDCTESEDKAEEIVDENKNSPQKNDMEVSAGEMSPRRLEVMKRLKFPTDLLTLRQVEESEFLQTGIPWSVMTQVTVSKGSTIGPYQGETVALSSIKPGELVLQVSAALAIV